MELKEYYLAVKELKAPEGLSEAAAATWLDINTDKLRKHLTTDQLLLLLKDTSDLKTGAKLFNAYQEEASEYGQTLMTMWIYFGEEETLIALAKAERLGKRLVLVEDLTVQGHPTGFRFV